MLRNHVWDVERAELNTIATATALILVIGNEAEGGMILKCMCGAYFNTGSIGAMHTLVLSEEPFKCPVLTIFFEHNFSPSIG
jgi:hypothetical protein